MKITIYNFTNYFKRHLMVDTNSFITLVVENFKKFNLCDFILESGLNQRI